MTRCPEADVVLTVAAAVGWSEDELRHAADCQSCRETRAALRATREALTGERAPRPGFTDAVLASLPPATSPVLIPIRLVGAVLLPAVVGATTFVALLASPGAVAPGLALAAAGTAAAATALAHLRHRCEVSAS